MTSDFLFLSVSVSFVESSPEMVDDVRETIKDVFDKTLTQDNLDKARETGSKIFGFLSNSLAKDQDVAENRDQ